LWDTIPISVGNFHTQSGLLFALVFLGKRRDTVLTMRYETKTPFETMKAGKDFLSRLLTTPHTGALLVGLYGNLGTGKTTFTQAIAQGLGVIEIVASPTYVIEKIYKLNNQPFEHFIHFDAYRIEKSAELIAIGWPEIIANPKNLVVIEWPEQIADIIPEVHTKVHFTHIENGGRVIETSI
jgi:tRNA threonylcarbamoyladenosine biosynthesis protein TsaE